MIVTEVFVITCVSCFLTTGFLLAKAEFPSALFPSPLWLGTMANVAIRVAFGTSPDVS